MKRCLQSLLPVFLLVATPLWGETISRRFEVSPGGLLTIRAERAAIEVRSGSGSSALIELIPGGSLQRIEDDYEVDIRQSGNQLIVEVDYLKDWGGWLGGWKNWNKSLRIVATVPHEFSADLKTSGGSIKIDDLAGEVASETSGGSITAGRIQGPVKATTSGGSIELRGSVGSAYLRTSGGGITVGEVDGDVDVETSGGSIRLEHANGRVRAETSGGGITVREVSGPINASTSGGSIRASISRQPDSDCSLSTSGGGIDVRLAPGLGFELDARTSGGKVRANFPGAPAGSNSSRLTGRVNAGGPRLVLQTSGGSISVESLRAEAE